METNVEPERVVPESMFALESENRDSQLSAKIFGDVWPEYCNPSYKMPGEIEVKVSLQSGDYFFPVHIIKAANAKPYFGGYVNKLNGRLYHHANSQTPTDNKKATKDFSNLRSRETQTFETKSLSIQTYRECGTQMERIDLRLDTKRDATIVPRPYYTAAQLMEDKIRNCIEIQRCWRGYMARCRANQIRQRNKDFERKNRDAIEQDLSQQRAKQAEDVNRRLHPQTNADFAILYNELDSWRRQEITKIKASCALGPERDNAMTALLNDETKSLQSIQQLKLNANKDLFAQRTAQMLEHMARPHRWQLSNGDVAQVQTPATQRAKELLELHKALTAPLLSTDERLDVLLHVKWTVREFDTALTRDIIDLIDREADLLNRGRPPKTMEKLRVRLNRMFLQFLENPEYNPRAAEFVGLLPSTTLIESS